jgi:hypothetical protein
MIVSDDVWMCQGQEDQVGLRVGQHKQCPDPMEAEKRARRRREEAEREVLFEICMFPLIFASWLICFLF